MRFNRLALTLYICTVSSFVWSNDNISLEIQELRNKLEQLEKKAQLQHQQLEEIKMVRGEASTISQPKLKFDIKPYGFIRADAAYHFQGSDKIFNKINTVPLDDSPQSVNGRTLFNVNASRFGLDFQTDVENQKLSGKLEVDFRGGSDQDQLRIRHAYVKVNNWILGQTTSPFVSADILPEMVDFLANVGGGVQRNPMVQYQHKFDQNIMSSFALEDGSNSRNIDDKTRLPAFTSKTQFKSDDGKSTFNVRTLALQKKTSADDAIAWGVGLGGIYNLNDENKFHADYYHVRGDNKFMLFANDAYVLNADKQIVENEYDSLALGWTHKWSSQWRSTLGVGVMQAHDGSEYVRLLPTANESLYQGWLNLFYAPNKSLTYALEYVHGERTTFAGKEGTDSRFETMVRYAF